MVFRKKYNTYTLVILFSFCFFFLFFGLFISSENASAVSVQTSSFDLHYSPGSGLPYRWRNGILYGDNNPTAIDADGYANMYQFTTSGVQAGGNSASIHFETNIVATWGYSANLNPWVNLPEQNVIVCNSSPSASSTISRNLSTVTTLWGNRESNTLTLYGDVTVTGLTAGTTYQFVCAVGNDNYAFLDPSVSVGVWFEQNPMTISWFTDQSQALAQTQINQNETIINLNQQMINDSQEYYDKTYDSIDNISNQSPSDISDSTSSQTSSIIGAISSFISALGSIQIGSCEVTLPFPNYAGGSQVVNPCSGKENAPTIVQIGSSMLLIGTFIPLAFIVLKMIFNEIRSWTNG